MDKLELDLDTLQRLFRELNLEENPSIKELNNQLQERFLRPAGSERQQLNDRLDAKLSSLIPILRALGFIDEVAPKLAQYALYYYWVQLKSDLLIEWSSLKII